MGLSLTPVPLMVLIVGTFLGGLGLFLLAVSMITDGLKLAAGGALREVIARSTTTRLRGVGSGMLVTAVVQSSSAVTVATIGFVNAGLLNLMQATGIVYGANIGTTMTGWLVAAVGFEFKVEAFALPLIGAGMIARLLGPNTRSGALGEAVAGFGLFFIGVDVLRDAFNGFAANLDVQALSADTVFGTLLYVIFGFATTLVTQSSSAAIAITLTAATGGVLAIDAAAAMVIGANVGTTSTAMLSVIGATPNAKRVAAAHVMFNVVTGIVALAILPLMLGAVNWTGSILGLQSIPAVTLALFHTTFNVLGVAIMWPMTDALSKFLADRFRTTAETLSRPQYLDRNVAITPTLAIDALKLELGRMTEISGNHAIDAVRVLRSPPPSSLGQQRDAIQALTDSVEDFVTHLERGRLTPDIAGYLPIALRISNYLEEIANLAQEVAGKANDINSIKVGAPGEEIARFQAAVIDLLTACRPTASETGPEALQTRYDQLRQQWKALKSVLLQAAAGSEVPVAQLNSALEGLRGCLRIAEQTVKAAQRLTALNDFDPGRARDDAELGVPSERPAA